MRIDPSVPAVHALTLSARGSTPSLSSLMAFPLMRSRRIVLRRTISGEKYLYLRHLASMKTISSQLTSSGAFSYPFRGAIRSLALAYLCGYWALFCLATIARPHNLRFELALPLILERYIVNPLQFKGVQCGILKRCGSFRGNSLIQSRF